MHNKQQIHRLGFLVIAVLIFILFVYKLKKHFNTFWEMLGSFNTYYCTSSRSRIVLGWWTW